MNIKNRIQLRIALFLVPRKTFSVIRRSAWFAWANENYPDKKRVISNSFYSGLNRADQKKAMAIAAIYSALVHGKYSLHVFLVGVLFFVIALGRLIFGNGE